MSTQANPTNPVTDSGSDNVATTNPSNPSLLLLSNFARDSAAGAFMGSTFGFGSGLIKKKGLKASFSEAASSAKTCVILFGVHNLVVDFLKRLRMKDDVINAGVAGCCTGLALSFPGTPQVLLQSCVSYGAFSFIFEGLYRHCLCHFPRVSTSRTTYGVLPPLALPLPNPLKDSFSSFYKKMKQMKW